MESWLAVHLPQMHPCTKKYYEKDSYNLDPPSSVYADIKYNGGLFCSLLCDSNPQMEEQYPPGTRVERMDPASKRLLAGTVMDIPLFGDIGLVPSYTIFFNTLLPLFKFHSMNGGINFCNGGPFGWLIKLQDHTALSSHEAKIRATNATSKKIVNF